MSNKFDTYDILGIIVPGTLLLGWFGYCFPEAISAAPQMPYPDAFAVILLTALAVFLGQVVQAIASLAEPAIHGSWGGRPSDVALKDGLKRYLPPDTASRIRKKLAAGVGSDAEVHSLFLYAMQKSDGADIGRARRFNSLYAYHRALLVLVAAGALMLVGSMIWGWAAAWTWQAKTGAGIGFLLLFGLIWYRAWQRACYYVREVLLTAERLFDEKEQKKE